MKTIHKYEVFDALGLMLPCDAKVLTVQMQGDTPVMWVELTPQFGVMQRQFRVYGTGQQIPDDAEYLATWQQPPFVWHLYEVAVTAV